MAESSAELRAALPVEDDLAGADVAVRHTLLVHEVEGAEHCSRQRLKDALRNSADRLSNVLQTAVGRVVHDDTDAALRRVPVAGVDLDEGVDAPVTAVMLPIGDPVDEHLADLHVGDRHLLNRVHLQRWRMEHFLDRARGGLEDAEGDHLLEA